MSRKLHLRAHTYVLIVKGMRRYVKLSVTVTSTSRKPSICIRAASQNQSPIWQNEIPPPRAALFILQESLPMAIRLHRIQNDGFQTPLPHNLNPMIPQDDANTKERILIARKLAPRLAMERKTRTDGETVPEW